MRFLIDENLTPALCAHLAAAGHDAVHWKESGAVGAPDESVFEAARRDDRCVITCDLGFGAILASTRASRPSVLLLEGRSVALHRIVPIMPRVIE